MASKFYNDKQGIIYYNGTLTNELQTTYQTISAEFTQTLDQTLIKEPSDYDLTITRFQISSQAIPYWICPIQINQANPNLTPYGIQLQYTSASGNSLTSDYTYLIWQNDIATPFYGANIKVQELATGYYFSYNKQDFIEMFNNAMETALTNFRFDFITAYPADPNPPIQGARELGGQPNPDFPFLSWNEGLSKFQMYFSIRTYTGANPLQIYTNNILYPLIQFPSTNTDFNRPSNVSLAYRIEVPIDDNYYVPTYYLAYPEMTKIGYIVVYSDHDTRGVFSPLHRIIVSSNTLPTSSEIVQPSSSPFFLANPSYISQTVPSKIVSDFEPDMFSTNINNRDFIQYNQSVNNSRLISLQNSNVSIDKIDIKIYWSDFNNNVYPLVLFAGCSMDIKLAFVPRIYLISEP